MADTTFARRDKHNKSDSCLFCGCRKDDEGNTLRRVQRRWGDSEYVCTDCLREPETVAWMAAGGFAEAGVKNG